MKNFSTFVIAAAAGITLSAASADETLFGVDATIATAALDLPSFYIETSARPVAGLDMASSIDTLAFYTPMVARPSFEFDVQTSFDVPVPYERRAARPASIDALVYGG